MVLTLTLLLSAFCLFNTPAQGINIPIGSTAPDFTLASLEWDRVSLNEHKGEIVVLLYWNPEQKRSLLAIEDWQDLFSRYINNGVQVISIIPEAEKYDNVRSIIVENKIDFPVLIDVNRKVFGSYEVRVYPSTVIIDRNGTIAYDIPGHPLTYKLAVEGYLQYMLGEIDDEGLNEMLSLKKKVVDKDAVSAERNYSMAMKFAESEFTALAVNAAKKSLEHNAGLTRAHILLGFLFLDEREADSAFQEFIRALEQDPRSYDAKTGLGAALRLKGDIDGAIETLKEAARLNPYPQRTYYELGKAYELKGEKDKAAGMYKKAFEKAKRDNVIPSHIFKCQ